MTTALSLGVSVLPRSEAAPEPNLQQVQAQVRDLQMQAAAAAERAGGAQERLSSISARIDSIGRRAAREQVKFRLASETIQDMARNAYMNGGRDSTLQILLADDPTAFLNQASVLAQLQKQQVAEIRRMQTSGLRVAQTQAELAGQRKIAQAVQNEMAAAQSESESRLSEAQNVLAGLQLEDQRRLAQIARNKRAQNLAIARQLQKAQDSRDGQNSSSNTQGNARVTGSKRAQAAVKYALSQVGDPYSFSANPPSSWDCSKLTTAAWGKSGVGLTPLSYTQWDQTKRVPLSDIRPGDLVFYFGRGAHHVAMYIGGGKMVSASNPSDGVEVIDFLGPWYRERFSGVGRVI